ncbi:type II toxin-antitoxin system VapC family toxin [Nostoc sp. PCC 9305]|uniref:type II toxin-antitoxin system VapC family toxin n=1 Tax=Nostoc sp. PCC 9305 TaxID=296636 RepID=UPI0039C705CD
MIVDPLNDILLNPASYWEIAIKVSIGKYQIPENFETWMENQIQVNEFEILPIKVAHAAAIVTLPFHHKDPFDRLDRLCGRKLFRHPLKIKLIRQAIALSD